MPLPPILMQAAYRHGSATPWGGARLKELYNKDTPDARTGESLEVCAIRSLPSLDLEGTPLPRLVERYGKLLTGSEVKGDFPLLLKLIDARERLSVQVHPDDAYAQKHENKLGKNEAWVILHAQPGAQIVYGLQEGVDRAALREAASRQDGSVEQLLRFVDVQPGEVYYIPAGLVHAIGEGIVLYEIQQSSDVTYRFYDWERRDQHGNKRTLHLRQGLDVVLPELWLERAVPQPMALEGGQGRRELLLDTEYFRLERFAACEGMLLLPDRRRFAMLTAIHPAVLRYEDREMQLPAGHSALLPAHGEDLLITGEELLYACPACR